MVHVVPLTSTRSGASTPEVVIQADPTNGLDVVSAAQCQHIRRCRHIGSPDVRGQTSARSPVGNCARAIAVILDRPEGIPDRPMSTGFDLLHPVVQHHVVNGLGWRAKVTVATRPSP